MLLDVNVLLALAWPNHQFHHQARRWFIDRAPSEWNTCAITQLGFIRLSANPAFSGQARTPEEAASLLAAMTARPVHRYLADLPPPSGSGSLWRGVAGYRQTTDVYLAFVARTHGTKLATFDRKMTANREIRDVIQLIDPT